MKKKTEKKLTIRKKILVAVLSFLFLVLLIASFFGKNGLVGIYQAQKKKGDLLREINHLEKKMSKLERDVEELKNNPKAVEKKAREKLMLMKESEIVIFKKKER